MPPEHRAWMEAATTMLREQREACCPYTGPVRVEMVATWPLARTRPAWCSREAWATRRDRPVPYATAPDVDNVGKLALDAAVAAGILEDDRIVVELSVRKEAVDASLIAHPSREHVVGIFLSVTPMR